jgi:small subunit ribosomal protein S6
LRLYEGMFVMDNRQANRDWDGSLEKLKSILTKHGAEIVRCDKWGERKLAYEMDGRRRGTYVLMFFNAGGSAVTEIYRECELSEMILRALILQVPAIPPEDQLRPSDEYPVRRSDAPMGASRESAPAGPETAEA